MLTIKRRTRWICLIIAALLSYCAVGCSHDTTIEQMEETDNSAEETLAEEKETLTPEDTEHLWSVFIADVLTPYEEYIIGTEFLDLDGNGINELIVYDWGASANCGIEIFTIENGEVRSFYTGTNAVTHYTAEAKSLAQPSAYAVDFDFWGVPASYNNGTQEVPLWFQTSENKRGHILYSYNGSSIHSTADYYYFSCGSDEFLQVELLGSFRLEAVNANPSEYGWNCYVNGETVSADEYRSAAENLWKEIDGTYGVSFTAENVYDVKELKQEINKNLITGQFLRISEDLCVLVLDEETRERYTNDVYMKLLTDHPFVDPEKRVSLDAFSDGDRIAVDCMTIADLSPRVIDVTGVELIEEGNIEDVDVVRLAELVNDGDVSDVDMALLEWAGY